MYLEGYIVEEIWEGYSVFCSHRLTNDNLVDVIKFIPIFISAKINIDKIIEPVHVISNNEYFDKCRLGRASAAPF